MPSHLTLPNMKRLQSMLVAMLAGAALIVAAAVIDAPEARADEILVKYDQSKLLRLPRRVSEIIVGNPTIADISVQGGDILVITGKTFGITNVIALDNERQVIIDKRVMVERDQSRIVNLTRGDSRRSFSCTPSCNPSLTVGDDVKFFKSIASDSERKVKFAERQADGGAQNSGQ